MRWLSARVLAVAGSILLTALGASCRARQAAQLPRAQAVPPSPSPVIPTPLPSPPPAPGDAEMMRALEDIDRGEEASAAARLEAVMALGAKAPSRGEALFTLALLKANPVASQRDIARARSLLEEAAAMKPGPSRSSEIRLILSLLALEEEKERSLQDLRAQIEAVRGQAESLKAALAQREDELRRIKEILLEKTPGH